MVHLSKSVVFGVFAVALLACGGAVDNELDDDDLDISELDAALTSPDPGAPGAQEDAEDDDGTDCRDDDRGGHKHHRRHKFKVLDRLDGAKDKTITIAALPPGLPERLLAKLRRIDADANGLVTKDEAKAAWFSHKKKHDKHEKHDKHGRKHDRD